MALWGAWLVGGILLTYLLYLSSVHSYPGSSDGASVVLEGKAMLSNFTLTHWALSLDSFWLVDAPFYAVAVALVGVHPQLLHLVPAVIATCVIGMGAWIAQRGRGRLPGLAAIAVVVALLGLPAHALAEFFLIGPFHVATTLWCLIAFVALRKGRFGWGWLVAVTFLAAGLLGDLQTIVLGTAPIVLAGFVAMFRQRQWRAGAPAVAAAVVSTVLAEVVRRIALAIGTYSIGAANPRAAFHQMIHNAYHVIKYGAALGGVGTRTFGAPAVPPVLEVAHAIGLCLCVVAVVWALAAIVRAALFGAGSRDTEGVAKPGWLEAAWFEDVLAFAFLGGCATYVWFALNASAPFARYLTSAVVFGSILGARLAGRIAERARNGWPRVAVASVAALVAVGYVATFANTLTVAPPGQSVVHLATYLKEHHLTKGVGDFWSASIVTVESSDAVVVRPVVAVDSDGHVVRYTRLSTSAWYGGGFQFLVYNAVAVWGGVDEKSAVATFGAPQHAAMVGPYEVLTWSHDISVSGTGTYLPVNGANRPSQSKTTG
ncbi:MAG: hypothetical protein ABR925_04780 [Acidimicrobiales bacterium]